MINTSKISVLCNNRIAIPALQALLAQGKLGAIGVPEGNTDIIDFCAYLSSQSRVPVFILKKENFADQMDEIIEKSKAQYVFTMTFPWKISSDMIEKYPDCFFNFHYGLLPQMRGADPVFEALRSNATETGITVHAIENKIDQGGIIHSKILPLSIKMTHGSLCTNLGWLATDVVNETLLILQQNKKGKVQDETKARYFKRPAAQDVCISWKNNDAQTIESLTRACNPWNKGAYTQWNGWNIRVVESTVLENVSEENSVPGTIISVDEKNGLIVKCNNETQLRVDIVYTDEGFMSGHKLLAFGLKKGSQFANL